MCQVIKEAFFTILGGSITAGFGFWLFLYQRARNAKDEFSVFILDKRDSIPQSHFLDFYRKTKPEVRSAVFKLHPRLSRKNRSRLSNVWNEYNKIEQKDLADALEVGFISEATQRTKPSELLKINMDRFYEIAK